jgi:hypothetical protein
MGGSQMATDSSVYARVERLYSPLWLTTVFSPEVDAEFEALGLHPLERYFATRVAPIGAVSAPVVVATFFNFSPAAVERTIPEIWTRLSPQQLLDAQLAGVHRKLTRALAPLDGTVVPEALALLRRAAESATDHPEGRPLFAGYAAFPWPEDRYLQLWHAHYLLREFRGDGHISILASEGLSGLEALLLHIAWTPALRPCSVPREAGPTPSGTEPPTSSEAQAGSAGTSSSRSHQPGGPIGNGSRPARTTATPRPTGRPPATTWRSSPRSARRSGTPCAPTAPACSATSSRTTSCCGLERC